MKLDGPKHIYAQLNIPEGFQHQIKTLSLRAI